MGQLMCCHNIASIMAYQFTKFWGRVLVTTLLCLCLGGTSLSAAAQIKSSLTVADQLIIPIGVAVPFPIRYQAAKDLPSHTFIRIKNLPLKTVFTEGYQVSKTTWAIPLDRLSKLQIRCSEKPPINRQIRIELISLDGEVHAEKTISLVSGVKPVAPPTLASRNRKRDIEVRNRAADVMSAMASLEIGPPNVSPNNKQAGNTENTEDTGATTPKISSPLQVIPNLQNRQAAKRFLAKGNQFLLQGNINTARLFYRRAADLGFSTAAVALASTFDPNELSGLGIIGMQGDISQALIWYKRAAELGDPVAMERLKRLMN